MKFEVLNIQELTVICICGIALVAAVFYGQENLSMAIGSGLIGYLGGVTTGEKGENHE